MKYYFRCPSCGQSEDFVRPREEPSNLGCALLVLGGLLPALLFARQSSYRIQCGRCSYIFRQPAPPYTPFARGAVLIATAAGVIALGLTLSSGSSANDVTGKLSAEDGAGLLIALVILPCSFAALISNVRFRREMAKTWRMNPPAAVAPHGKN